MTDEVYERMLSLRSIQTWDVCPQCGGSGNKIYASSSTYMEGIGGAALTEDTCDECWGTGKQSKVGADLRKLQRLIQLLNRREPPSTVEIMSWLKSIRPQNRIRPMSAEGSQAQAKPTESSPAQATSTPKKRGSTRKKKKAPSRKAAPRLTMPSNA